MAILIMDIMVISNHINYLSWINKESYISIRHYITCIYQIPGFWGSTTFKLNFQSPPGDLSMHSCRMAKNWNSKTNQKCFRSQQDFEYLWIFVDSIQQGIFGKKHFFWKKKNMITYTYIHTYIHTCMHACMHYITLHSIPYHTIPYHTTPYHTTPHHTIHTYIHTYIHYIHT